eukprot:TRINITY_DN40638_c0_g1_i1.p1 TRINITY_DN40638_c0_g1~~TRINITY_DN40638_c0_g1_i1.p1  ORF type:complete len:181 (+),score=36.14 TRINITY_DN40638_c0_g1_i1:2-544(+)
MLSMYQHMNSEDVYITRNGPGFYPSGPKFAPWKWSRDVSGKLVGEIPMDSALINGRGRFQDNSVNLTVFDARPGHCFRVVASQEGQALRVSVDQHDLEVLASDGHPIEALMVQSLIVFPGETFDLAVSPRSNLASTAGLNFWVRAETLEVDPIHHPHPSHILTITPVSYTHLTLPTKRIV